MSAYIIANYSVVDADGYADYAKQAAAALRVGAECTLLALDTDTHQLEGVPAGRQTVVLEFESTQKAREIYESGEYQQIIGLRLDATSDHLTVLVEGVAAPD